MSRLDNVRRIVKEDYDPKYHQLIDRLAYVLNSFMEQVTTQVNGNLDFTNLNQDITTVKITVDSSGTPIGNNLIRTEVRNPQGIQVIRAISVNNPSTTFPTNTPFISYSVTTNTQVLKITHISGLPADTAFNLRIVTIG